MTPKYTPRIIVVVLVALIMLGAVNAMAASDTFASGTHLQEQSTPIAFTANSVKPAACTMNLTSIVVCTGGNCDGTAANELLLGTSNGERIRGRGGRDCILGGDGDDRLVGNGGTGGDVCFGGAGADVFTTCETCTGGPGIDDFNTCTTVTDRGPGE